MKTEPKLRNIDAAEELAIDFNDLLQLNQDPEFHDYANYWRYCFINPVMDYQMAHNLQKIVEEHPDILLVTHHSGKPAWSAFSVLNNMRLNIIKKAFDACHEESAMYKLMWSPDNNFKGDIIRIAAFNAPIDNGETFNQILFSKKSLEHPRLDQSLCPESRIFHPLTDDKSGNLALYLLSIANYGDGYFSGDWFEFLNQDFIINQLKNNDSSLVNNYLNLVTSFMCERSHTYCNLRKDDTFFRHSHGLIDLSINLSKIINENKNEYYLENLIKVVVSSKYWDSKAIEKCLVQIYSEASFKDLLPDVSRLVLDPLGTVEFKEIESVKEKLRRTVSTMNVLQENLEDVKEETHIGCNPTRKKSRLRL